MAEAWMEGVEVVWVAKPKDKAVRRRAEQVVVGGGQAVGARGTVWLTTANGQVEVFLHVVWGWSEAGRPIEFAPGEVKRWLRMAGPAVASGLRAEWPGGFVAD